MQIKGAENHLLFFHLLPVKEKLQIKVACNINIQDINNSIKIIICIKNDKCTLQLGMNYEWNIEIRKHMQKLSFITKF